MLVENDEVAQQSEFKRHFARQNPIYTVSAF